MKAKFKVGDKVRLNPNMNYELINLATICQYHKLGIIYTVVTSKIDCGGWREDTKDKFKGKFTYTLNNNFYYPKVYLMKVGEKNEGEE